MVAVDARRPRALVVDDVPEIGEFYRKLFARLSIDADVVIERDPQEAMRQLREAQYDLVVSDFRMQDADGIDVLCTARAENPSGRRVLMTGYNEIPSPIGRIQQARIDAYLQKPLRAQDLMLLLSDLLSSDDERLESYRATAREMEEIAVREETRSGDAHATAV